MEEEDIRNWLIRNKRFISISQIEKEIGVPNAYIKFFILEGKKYPSFSAKGRYLPYAAFLKKVAEVIMSIRRL